MNAPIRRARIVVAAAGAAVLAAVAVGYARVDPSRGPNRVESEVASVEEEGLGVGPKIQVLTNGRLSFVSGNHPDGPRTITPLACDRA